MTRAPRLSGKQLIGALRRADFRLARVSGSHHIYQRHPKGPLVVVPVHGNEPLPQGTLLSILHQAGLSLEELQQLLAS